MMLPAAPVLLRGGSLNNYPKAKLVTIRALRNLIRYFRHAQRDLTNGFKSYRKEVLDTKDIDNPESSGFDLTVEILIKAHIPGYRSSEMAVNWSDRPAVEAKRTLSRNGSIYGRTGQRSTVS